MDEETKYLEPFDFSVDIDTTADRDRLNRIIDNAFGTGLTMRWDILKGNKVGIKNRMPWWEGRTSWGKHFRSIEDFKKHLLLLGYNGQPEPIKNFKEGEWVYSNYRKNSQYLMKYTRVSSAKGFYNDSWGTHWGLIDDENLVKATVEQVKEALIREGKRRYGNIIPHGTEFKRGGRKYSISNTESRGWEESYYIESEDRLKYFGITLYQNGEWAEVSDTPKTATDTDEKPDNGVNVGDWAVVIRGYEENDGREGMVGRIKNIDDSSVRYNLIENSSFRNGNDWCIDVRKATDDEITQHLKKEAERRGLWDNPDVECLFMGKKNKSPNLKPVYTKEIDCLWSKYGRIYEKGRWANKIAQDNDDPLLVDLEQYTQSSSLVDSSGTAHYFYRTDWDLLGIDPEKFLGQQKPTKNNLVHQIPVGVQKKKQKKRRIKIV